MKSYYSITYLWLFLPLVMLAYQVMPKKYRWTVLLGASYVFFWLFSQKLIVYLMLSTVIIHVCGLWLSALEKQKKEALATCAKEEKKTLKALYQKKKKWVMLAGVLLNLGMLVVLKYTAFFAGNINTALTALGASFQLQIPKFALPLGISFYTMQAMSYILDIYRGTLTADRNLGRLALYMSFFPGIMEGPICRYGDTAMQLWAGESITWRNMTRGMQRILFGCLKKMVIADHLDAIVKPVFEFPGSDGGMIALAMVCYTIQLYMEFSGTMDVVIGTAEIFGVRMPENFQQPFLSRTISEFWMRWHITLGAWFRDYIFYPVSMSKTLRRWTTGVKQRFGPRPAAVVSGAVALFSVWIFNGLWHGDGWQYIFFGMYHFTLILAGTIVEPHMQAISEKYHINRKHWAYRLMQTVRTVILVCIGELFFRAPSLAWGMNMFHIMVSRFMVRYLNFANLALFDMEKRKILVILAALIVVAVVHILREKKIDVREKLAGQNVVLRWAVYYGLILFIFVFGAYGLGYIPIDPIYAQF